MTLSAGTLDGFKADTAASAALSTKVSNATKDLTITPVATNSKATIKVEAAGFASDQSFSDLDDGTTVFTSNKLEVVKNGSAYTVKGLNTTADTNKFNVVKVTVTPENADTTKVETYFIKVDRASATASDIANLSALKLAVGATAPANTTGNKIVDFKSTNVEYNLNVANTEKEFRIDATEADNSDVEIKVNGALVPANTGTLKIGENVITVKVTAENGVNTRTYTIKVNRADVTASDVKTLNAITLSAGTVAGFTADKDATTNAALTATVPADTKAFTITPVATDSKASVVVTAVDKASAAYTVTKSGSSFNVADLKEGANVFTVKVTPENATTPETYTVTVTKVAATAKDDAFLSGLALSAGSISFNKNTASYTTNVAYGVTKINVTPQVQDVPVLNTNPGATITVNGKAVAHNTASGDIALAVGPNTITVTTTAADGKTTKTYTVTVVRAAEGASNKATLNKLTLSAGTLNGFTADTGSGNVAVSTNVANTVKDLTITPVATDAKATVEVSAKDAAGNKLEVTNASGAYTIKGLSEGANAVTVKVVAEDGSTTVTYDLTANRAASGANIIAKLDALVADLDGNALTTEDVVALSPAFATDKEAYTAYVDNDSDKIYFTSTQTAASTGAKIYVNDKLVANGAASTAVPLAIGNNEVKVKVVAEDLVASTTYTVNVVRASASASADATLSGITSVTPGKINETFDKNTLAYTATVNSGASTFTFKPELTNANARLSVTGSSGLTVVANSNGTYTVTGLATGNTNVITVSTIAEDNKTTKSYTITVDKLNGDATVSDIKVGSASADLTAGTVTAGTGITVTPTANDTKSIVVTLKGAVVASKDLATAVVASGDKIVVTVTAEDGTVKTYTITAGA